MSDSNFKISKVIPETDEVTWSIIPNSFTYTGGYPTRKAEGTDTGEVVLSENFEEAFTTVKFSVHATAENLNNARMLAARKAITTKFGNGGGNFSRVQKTGVFTNEGEYSLGGDGQFDITIVGTPVDFS